VKLPDGSRRRVHSRNSSVGVPFTTSSHVILSVNTYVETAPSTLKTGRRSWQASNPENITPRKKDCHDSGLAFEEAPRAHIFMNLSPATEWRIRYASVAETDEGPHMQLAAIATIKTSINRWGGRGSSWDTRRNEGCRCCTGRLVYTLATECAISGTMIYSSCAS
jgi:hypothetical protein